MARAALAHNNTLTGDMNAQAHGAGAPPATDAPDAGNPSAAAAAAAAAT